MDWKVSIILSVAIVVVTWIIFRCRQRRFEKHFYSLSGMMTLEGDLKDRLSWVETQPLVFQKRMNTLYVLSGFLACRVDSLNSARSTFTTDRIMARLQATLDEVDNESFEIDEFTAKSQEALRSNSLLTRKAAQALLHQLAVETTRRTASLPTNKEARHYFRLEMNHFGSLMHKAGVLADEVDKLLSEPLIDDPTPSAQTEGNE